MLTSRPDRKPDLTIADIRIDDAIPDTIFYKLADNKTNPEREEDWVIPHNSTFDPGDKMQLGESYAVWCESIDSPYVTTKGKARTKKRYDWVWFEPLADYRRSTQSVMAAKVKRNQINDLMKEIDERHATLKRLFDGF